MNESHTHTLVAGRGYWGVGQTFAQAVENARWLRKGDKVMMASCPEGTRVDEMGQVYTPKGTTLGEWSHGKIGGSANGLTFRLDK